MFDIIVDGREIEKGKKATGLGRILISFLHALHKNGKKVLVLSDPKTDELKIKSILGDKVSFVRIPFTSNPIFDQFIIPALVGKKSKIFFSIYPKFPVALRFLGYKITAFVVDLIDFSFYQRLFLRAFGKVPHNVIAISDTWRREIEKLMGREVIRIYSDISYLRRDGKTKSEIVAKLPKKYILYVGNFNPHKNVPVLVEAFRMISDIVDLSLVLVGGGGKKASEDLLKMINRTPRVFLIRGADEDELVQLYRNSFVFVFPSLSEGQGLPPVEACYFGVPVLVSDIPVFRETMGDAAIFFDPKSPKDLAEKILMLYRNESLRKEVATRCKKVGERFASFDIGEEIFKLIFGSA